MSDSNEQPSEATREQLEAHVVAMLLGETSSFEKAQLQHQIRDDERLAKFCSRKCFAWLRFYSLGWLSPA